MSKEVTIKKLDNRIIKRRDVEKEALKCLSKQGINISSSDNISKELFEDSYRLYLNPTEELSMKSIVKSDKPVATVLASGDFALDAIFHGAKDVLTFDINRLQLYPASLKLSSLQNMNYNDYWEFFSEPSSDNYLSPKSYERLKKASKTDPNVFSFFDILINRRIIEQRRFKRYISEHKEYEVILDLINDIYSDDPKRIQSAQEVFNLLGTNIDFKPSQVEYDLFLHMLDPSYEQSRVLKALVGLAGKKVENSYIENEESFKQTKDLVRNASISFIKSDISKIKDNLEKTKYIENPNFSGFQSIYLSNIPEYLKGDKFSDIIDNQLMPLLEAGGMIVYCCQGTSKESLSMSESELNSLREKPMINKKAVGSMIFSDYHQLNNIEAYNILKDKYDIEIKDAKKLSINNGKDDQGMFIYVKKNNK